MNQLIYQTPSFSIFKHSFSKEKVDTLKHCFFQRGKIDATNPPAVIRAEDGNVYTAVYDSPIPIGLIDVIISFQAHTYGKFAVVRTVSKEYKREQNE